MATAKRIKGLLIDPSNGGDFDVIRLATTSDYKELVKQIDCKYVEVATRLFGKEGKSYVILCDEDGKLKQNKVSIVTRKGNTTGAIIETFVGKCLILRYNSKGRILGLKNEDIEYLLMQQGLLVSTNTRVLQCYI